MTNSIKLDEIYDGNSHIKVFWEDTLDNYSKTKEKQVEKYFQNKYKTNKVKVIFIPITSKNSSVVAQGSADASELVLDDNYQKALIAQYIKDNKINIVMEHLMRLDSSVNIELENYKEQTSRYKTFTIKEVEFSNFLSYGDDNKIVFDDKFGVISVVSDPPNYGGKTILTVDLLLFLFFGSTTKSEKYEDIFNLYTNKDFISVVGKLEIEKEIYIIERLVSRTLKKDGSYKCEGTLNYYKPLPQGGKRELNGDEKSATQDIIQTYVGSYDDFLITILTTGDNLDDLIKTKPTERGRILTKFIGLEFFREKESICKKKYDEWKLKSKLHHNNLQDILNKIESEKLKIAGNTLLIDNQKNLLSSVNEDIVRLENDRETHFKSRHSDIDIELYKVDEETISAGITNLKASIGQKEIELEKLISKVPKPESYDVDAYGILKSRLKDLTEKDIKFKTDIAFLEQTILSLKNSEICELCKRSLEGIDHTHDIGVNEENKKQLQIKEDLISAEIITVEADIEKIDLLKNSWDEYNKNQLLIDKATLELRTFNDSLNRGNEKLAKYKLNKVKIEKNKQLDTEIQKIKFQLDTLSDKKENILLEKNSLDKDNQLSENYVKGYEELIKELKNEEIVDQIFRVYLNVYGKNGISKMVLATMMPVINSHLQVLLSDTCDFILEMRMNEKTEVEFWMVDQETGVEKKLSSGSGYEKTVSSLALRCVLSKVCSLPKPNIIVFDEITGKVANEFLDKVGLFFDKLRQFFDHIWIITHNPLVQEWANHTVKINKVDNISHVLQN